MWPPISKFERANDKGSIGYMDGVQLARTDELTLLCVIDDLIVPNGYSVSRNSLIANGSGKARPWGLALELKGYLPPATPDLDLRSMRHCLQDIQRKKIFVSLHFEFFDPNIAYLGDIVSVNKKKCQLRCVTPSGVREKKVTGFSIAECTRVDFLGGYESAIQLLAVYFAANDRSRSRKKMLQELVRRVKGASPAPKSAKGRLRTSPKGKKA